MKTPLTVTSVHQPKAIDNSVAVNSVNIIREVLSAAGYDDHWTITFTRQSTKRSEIKFQYSRKSTANSLLIRTKPGNNSTCWDALLTVPKKYGIDEVIGTLKRIHPRKLTLGPSLKLTHESAKMPFEPIPPPSIESILGIHAVIPKEPRIKERPTKEDVKSALDDVDQEVQKRLAEAERQAKLEAKQTLALHTESNWVQSTPEGTLLDIPIVRKDIGNEPVVLDHALVAVASRMEANRRFVTIPDAVGTLISQLRLDFFVTQQDNYKSPTRTAAVILKGLVNKGLLQKDGRYEFTVLGLRRLQKLSEVDQEIFSRLNINWMMDLSMPPATKMPILPPVPMPTTVATPAPSVAMASVRENQTRLKPLSEEIDRIMSQISDYETIEADCVSSLQTVEDALKGLGATVATLRAELESQIARMNTYEQQKVNLALDLNEAQKIKASYASQLEKVKSEIRTILGAA